MVRSPIPKQSNTTLIEIGLNVPRSSSPLPLGNTSPCPQYEPLSFVSSQSEGILENGIPNPFIDKISPLSNGFPVRLKLDYLIF